MAIEDNNRYYGLDGDVDEGQGEIFETAENIDHVLRDLTKIIDQAPNTDAGKSVVMVLEDNEKKFKLGEASKPINGAANKILVATGPSGNPANWAMSNSPSYYAVTTRTGETTPGSPTEFTIGTDVPSNYYPAAFGHIGASTTNPATVPSFHDGYITRDTAMQKIAGTSKINIGDDNADYTSQNRKFWDKNLSGPRIDIGGTAVIEMEGTGDGNSDSDTPVVSMRGRCLIDMCGSRSVTPNTDGPYNRKTTMRWWPYALGGYYVSSSSSPDPFWSTRSIAESTVAFPLLKMHDSSTISMEGAPIFQMRGNSLLNINGQVAIDINGVNGIDSGITNRGSSGVGIDIRPGTFIQMGVGAASLPPSKTLFKMTENQIVACCSLPGAVDLTYIGGETYTTDNGYGYGYPNASNGYFPFRESALSNRDNPFVFANTNVMTKWNPATDNNTIGSWKTTGMWSSDPTTYTQGPALTIQGKTRMVIGDGGTTAMMIGGQGNVSLKLQPQTMSSLEISLGSVGGADVINIANGGSGYNIFNHCAAAGANTKYDFTPHGDTYIKFDPQQKFYHVIEPKETEMMFQWKKFYGFFQGNNNYALLDGEQTHIENVGNTFIMRDDTTQEVYETGEGSEYSRFFKVYSGYNNRQEIDVEGTLPSSSEEFAQTQLGQDVIADFNSHKSTLPDKDSIHNAIPFLALQTYNTPEPNYDPTKDRYYNVNYPMQFTLRGQDAEIEFDSTTSWGSDRTSYASVPQTAYTDPDVIQAIKDELGPDITQYFYQLYKGSMSYKRTTNGSTYHYTIKNPYVELRQTFTSSWATSSAPSAPASGTTYNSGYLVNQEIDAQYNSTTLPTGWVVYSTTSTTSELRKFTYTAGTVDALNKWKRYAQVKYSVAPDYYETVDYRKPIQTDESGGTKPVFQMYNRSNFMMRADTIFKPFYNEYWQRPLTPIYTYELTPTETYTGLTVYSGVVNNSSTEFSSAQQLFASPQYQAFVESVEQQHPGDTIYGVTTWTHIWNQSTYKYTDTITYILESDSVNITPDIATFVNGADYTTFETYLTNQYPTKKLWRIAYIENAPNSKIRVYFALQDLDETEFLKDPSGDEPIFEMVGKSQLRMYNGAYIKGESKLGETTFTFGSTTTSESPVSFTLAELAALKNMLINPPQSFIPLTQAEYDQLDPPDPDTLYVITDGATAQMLPDASVEEF